MKQILIVFPLLFSHFSYCPCQMNLTKSKTICEQIIYIDSVEFISNRQYSKQFDSTTNIAKVNSIIKIPLKDTVLVFRDDTTNELFFEYTVVGTTKSWLLMSGRDYNQDYFYLINMITGKTDTLIGYPLIFHNILLCIEGDYADSTKFIELWKIEDDKVQLIRKFSLRYCNIYMIGEIYLKDKFLYMQYNETKYLKIKI